MEIFWKSQIFLVLLIFLQRGQTDSNSEVYEPVKDACQRCTCLSAIDENKHPHYVLGCSIKNFTHILADWPEEFGTNHDGAEIVVTYSGNSLKYLQQLPETNATVSFSCRHCEIKEIASAVFMDTTNILRLDLSWNELTGDVLHPDIFRGRYENVEYDPIALEDIDFSYNLISTLDRRIFEHVPYLKRLNLAFNNFKSLDDSTTNAIAAAKSLEYLNLSNNKLKALPSELFENSDYLKELHLEGNAFKEIPGALTRLGRSLQALYIGDNPIEAIKDDVFLGYKALKFLNISSMPLLTSVVVGTFIPLKSLETVICNNNPNLTKFDAESLKRSKNLKDLDLSNCGLKKLHLEFEFRNSTTPNHVIFWKKLRTLNLSGNPWHCDCILANVLYNLGFHDDEKLFRDSQARCSTPYDYSGFLLRNLTLEGVCRERVMKVQLAIPVRDNTPGFLRPKSIMLTIGIIVAVASVGLLVGFSFVVIRRKLKQDTPLFTTPIRYTTVRNSTISVEQQH